MVTSWVFFLDLCVFQVLSWAVFFFFVLFNFGDLDALDFFLLQKSQWFLLTSHFNQTDLELNSGSDPILFYQVVNLFGSLNKLFEFRFIVVWWLFGRFVWFVLFFLFLLLVGNITVIIHSVYFGTDLVKGESLSSHFLKKNLCYFEIS